MNSALDKGCRWTRLDGEGQGQQIAEANKRGCDDGKDDAICGGYIRIFCLLTHVATCIKARDRELRHEDAQQEDVPAPVGQELPH